MKFIKRIFLLALTFLIMSSLLLAGIFLITDKSSQPSSTARPAAADTRPPTTATEPGPGQMTLKTEDIKDSGLLRLVNSRYDTKTVASDRLAKTANGKFRLRRDIMEDVEAFMAFARDASNGLYITSAFRTRDEQAVIYRKTANKSLVQPAGYSEHHTGLAVDLVPLKSLQVKGGQTLHKEQEFMALHSWKFGLVKRYPQGKEDLTGIDHEYWHFRYVGQPHAEYMHSRDLVLEEYLDLLREKQQLTFQGRDGDYTIYWRKARDGRITLPEAKSYTASSTNTGAWIITVREP